MATTRAGEGHHLDERPSMLPGGISMRDAQMMLRVLTGLNMVGGDICEVVPSLDPTGMTCINAANLMFELTCLAAVARSGVTTRNGKSGSDRA